MKDRNQKAGTPEGAPACQETSAGFSPQQRGNVNPLAAAMIKVEPELGRFYDATSLDRLANDFTTRVLSSARIERGGCDAG